MRVPLSRYTTFSCHGDRSRRPPRKFGLECLFGAQLDPERRFFTKACPRERWLAYGTVTISLSLGFLLSISREPESIRSHD